MHRLNGNGSQRNENQDNSELLLSTHQRANNDKEATTHAVGKGGQVLSPTANGNRTILGNIFWNYLSKIKIPYPSAQHFYSWESPHGK